jgi:hypothetical protein
MLYYLSNLCRYFFECSPGRAELSPEFFISSQDRGEIPIFVGQQQYMGFRGDYTQREGGELREQKIE